MLVEGRSNSNLERIAVVNSNHKQEKDNRAEKSSNIRKNFIQFSEAAIYIYRNRRFE